MKSLTVRLLVIFVALLAAGTPSAFGANVSLRARSNHQGTMVRLGDIADISAASTTELNDLSTTVLLPAPAPGTNHFLRRSQIRDLLVARGVDLGAIYMNGADVVELSVAKPQAVVGAVGGSSGAQPTREEIDFSLQALIQRHLNQQTGHTRWRIETPLDSATYLRLAKLGYELTVSGGRKPWTGRQYFKVVGSQTDQDVTVVTTVTKIQPVVTVLRTIQRGDLIRTSDVEIRQHEGHLSKAAVSSLAEAVGMEAQRTIKADTIVLENHLRAPLLVERGETVTIFARTAGITVRTFAVARQDGAHGELVQVERLNSKERFVARVSGRRQLEVLATGATTGDFATLPRHEPLRR
jgi:flagella basal body P-ring formation protein FlgA